MSYYYTQKKQTTPCQQEAIFTLQKIFPQANLSQLGRNSSVWEMLEKSAKNLPRPGLGDITSVISNMKCVVDNQQLKIQKNMIEIEREQEMIMSTQKEQQQQYKAVKYGKNNDHPTATKLLFNGENDSSYNNHQQQSHQMEEQEQQDYEKIEIESKQQFFGDDEIDYFTPCNPVKRSFIDDDDEEDVKKYLVFDF